MSHILTHTGKLFDLLRPDSSLIDPRDIAHALAHLCRFNGHCNDFYSVAQHNCIVADLVPDDLKLAALLHDATEAYIGDMTRPLKQQLTAFQHVESGIWQSICERFNIDADLAAAVKHADMIALATERRDLMPHHPASWDCLDGVNPMVERIRIWGVTEARNNYFQRLMDQLSAANRRKAGTQIQQDTAEQSPALLCSTIEVAAQEKNSLCCAAAGITSSLSATAEGLIPHEKLRGAAHPDASLLARSCPHAQPVVGYTHVTKAAGTSLESKASRRYWPADLLNVRPEEWAVMSPKHVAEFANMTEVWQLLEAAQKRISYLEQAIDTQLIEWLDKRGDLWCEPETSQINFPHREPKADGYQHIRDALIEAYEQDMEELAGGDA